MLSRTVRVPVACPLLLHSLMIIHDRSVCDYIIAMAEFIAKPATFRSIVLLHANDYFSDEVKVIFRPGLEGVSIR